MAVRARPSSPPQQSWHASGATYGARQGGTQGRNAPQQYYDRNTGYVDEVAATNAWRNPAFYVGPNYRMPEFSFNPPHTLFIDAALQAQDNADLITSGDRTDFDYIIDAVTHQPIGGRQAAIKGPDGVFYWDLSSRTKSEGDRRTSPLPSL